MLNAAKVPIHLRHVAWPEAARAATELKNLLVSYSQTKSSYELFHGLPSDHVPFFKTFGDMAVVENFQTCGMRVKLADHGKPVMYMLGMMPNHAKDTYRFLNIATNQVINSWNVIWLNKSCGNFMNLGPDQVSFIQSQILECVIPPTGIQVLLMFLLFCHPLCLDPGPTIRPPVVFPVGAPSPVVTIIGPHAFVTPKFVFLV
jgi:hypothetical protein